ncbi:hypothetical protein ACTXT7_002976 [Hymenolepis weldensis]
MSIGFRSNVINSQLRDFYRPRPFNGQLNPLNYAKTWSDSSLSVFGFIDSPNNVSSNRPLSRQISQPKRPENFIPYKNKSSKMPSLSEFG